MLGLLERSLLPLLRWEESFSSLLYSDKLIQTCEDVKELLLQSLYRVLNS